MARLIKRLKVNPVVGGDKCSENKDLSTREGNPSVAIMRPY